jgi:SAM-dependent methyltransferase
MFAKSKAEELNLNIKTIVGNACDIDTFVNEKYDHVMIMGPLYHLLDESDRRKAVSNSLKLLKPKGIFYASYISSCAGIIYLLREDPSMIENTQLFDDFTYFAEDRSFSGKAFTDARFERVWDIVPFMNEYNLVKLHLLGSEGILSPFKNQVMNQSKQVLDKCIDLAIKVCERKDLLSYSEHLLYIGRKQ